VITGGIKGKVPRRQGSEVVSQRPPLRAAVKKATTAGRPDAVGG
jgi:hypothetical protein